MKIRLPAVEVRVIVKKIAPTSINMAEGRSKKAVGTLRRYKFKLILPAVAAGNVEDLETLWTGPWDMGLKSSVKSEIY